jgi:methylphosphotriester-DNA--protein-cysteine methyltransferase
MIQDAAISESGLRSQIRQGHICFGGNKKLKIYGTLQCASGKRMKRKNRVFFSTEDDALQHGFRPCGHCMKQYYQQWKKKVPL